LTLDDEITALTAKWYRYVNLDAHKDRDCHFYIEKIWSYGNRPKYRAYHDGYVAEHWQGPLRQTSQKAHEDLRDFLKGEIESAIEGAKRQAENPDGEGWDYYSTETLEILS
jgi:hypothetical protein